MPNDTNLLKSYKLAYQDRTIFLKNSLLCILIVACFSLGSLFFFALLQDFTSGNLIGTCIFWIIGLCLLPIIFLVLSIKDFLFWNLVISFSAFIPLFLNHQWNKTLWLILGIIFALLLLSRIRIKMEYNDLINLQWIRIVGKGSFYILLALLMFFSALIYLQQEDLSFIEQEGTKFLDIVLSQTETIQLPFNLGFSGTIDEILGKYISQQTPDLGEIGSILNKGLIQQTKSNLSQFLDYPITGKERVSSFIIGWLKSRWQTLSSSLKIGLGILVFLTVLSVLKFLNIVFSIILAGVSWIFLQILLSIKYIRVKRVGVEKQEIIIA